ncbi:hypothetical protein AOCH_005749 [Aspergillus ochraceoroseus]|uniref:GAT domain-containing protein n=1 Tax=Aspergillus ochraceoroseus TaxID=138278 RepID=A0A0F8TZW4_9EURO|nr:hypothetical protein AOCH_005749 [Aspergillus ochraceoroseus]
MKRILSTINKRSTPSLDDSSKYAQDSPEGIVMREVTAFCKEGQGPDNPQGTEFVHLPTIVESAESSPNAAREAPISSYNAIMLARILIDNPGHTFSRNLDAKFVGTVKDLLRQGTDMGVQRFLRETLDALEIQRSWDEDLALLLQMWKKEKSKMEKVHSSQNSRKPNSRKPWSAPQQQQQQQHPQLSNFGDAERPDSLPAPDELAVRVAEAKTSAKLLIQFVQSTPPAELLSHDLIQEFSGRCRRATRAMQSYINATDPTPDEDTLLTLIETNDELSVALSKHQRAMLQARKLLGQQESAQQSDASSPNPSSQSTPFPAPSLPPRSQTPPSDSPPSPVSPEQTTRRSMTTRTTRSDISAISSNGTGPRYEYRSEDYQVQNPFADNYSAPSTLSAHAEHDDRVDEQDQWTEPHQRPVQQTSGVFHR